MKCHKLIFLNKKEHKKNYCCSGKYNSKLLLTDVSAGVNERIAIYFHRIINSLSTLVITFLLRPLGQCGYHPFTYTSSRFFFSLYAILVIAMEKEENGKKTETGLRRLKESVGKNKGKTRKELEKKRDMRSRH